MVPGIMYAQTLTRHHGDSPIPCGDDLSQLIPTSCSNRECVLYLDGALRTPVDRGLRHSVRSLLRRGQRYVVLDLSRVSRIDAAGISELVRAYNMASAVQGMLRIVQATPWVQQILERVGLFEMLSGPAEAGHHRRFTLLSAPASVRSWLRGEPAAMPPAE